MNPVSSMLKTLVEATRRRTYTRRKSPVQLMARLVATNAETYEHGNFRLMGLFTLPSLWRVYLRS
ncbi:hypothetical protein [Sporisorium scitamineum]|uniref:Uncharacterized protein n=1 Tax=Sporisorium scitamineum TaxID=49012 RepID=A0A0F7S3L1_9BASI|nr:hypothetical protein [Sporisorium scitamineum]